MSLADCVGRAVQGGEMDPKRAAQIMQLYQGQFASFQKSMGFTQAQLAAAQAVVQQVKAAAAQKRRVMQLQAAATQTQLHRMMHHRSITGQLSPGDYLQDMISNPRGAKGSTVTGKYEAVRRGFRRELTETMAAFRANLLGMRRNSATLRNVVDELFGKDTGDALAKSVAQAFTGVAEKARTRANAAGMHIGKLQKWGLPQSHDSRQIRKVGFDTWRDYIVERLDLDEMGRVFNNGLAFTRQSVEPLLKDAYEAIRTDGYSRRGPSANFGSAMHNRRSDHRFFTFKDGTAWTEYADRFGSGRDAFRVMLGHLDSMANDIALMEELGPNPANGFRFLVDAAKQIAAKSQDPGALEKAAAKAKTAEDMMDLFSGRTNIPHNRGFAMGSAALRNYLTSAHLGSAILSAVTDFNTQRLNAKFIGMGKAPPVKMLFKLMTDPALRAEANDAGLIFENAVDVGNAAARYDLEDLHVETAARLADFTIRSSGLGYLTELQKHAFGLEFMNKAAKSWHGKAFQDLDPRTQRTFEAYGINAMDWALINRAQIHTTTKGLKLLRAQEIEAAAGQKIADRYMEAVASLTEFAVPTSNLYAKALVTGKARPGSLGGEMIRFGLQFKAFPLTMLTTQFGRVMAEIWDGRVGNAMNYAAGLMIGNTLLGYVALNLKEMSKGRDPMSALDLKVWGAAFLQGGGAGIFGDFLFSDVNRFGSSFAETLAGPGVAALDDALRFTVGNAQQAIKGEDTDIGKDLVDLLRSYTPGGSLWYLRAFYEREVLDQLQSLIDPDAAKRFRAKQKSAAKQGKSYFYGPGSSIVTGKGNVDAPDLGRILGDN